MTALLERCQKPKQYGRKTENIQEQDEIWQQVSTNKKLKAKMTSKECEEDRLR